MDRGATWLPERIGRTLVRCVRMAAGLSSVAIVLLVVRLRRLCAPHLQSRWCDRGRQRPGRCACGNRIADVALTSDLTRHDLRFSALGQRLRYSQGGPRLRCRRLPRSVCQPLSTSRWPGTCPELCADAFGQERLAGHSHLAELARLDRRPRHQGRELNADRRLASSSRTACCSIRPTHARRPITRCSKCATCRTSPTSWSIPKARSNAATTGRREKTSHALLVGGILHVLYAGEDKTLRGVANFLSDPACPFELTLHRMMTTRHLSDGEDGRPHPVVVSAAREVLNINKRERQ